ncbi:MAG: sulfatase [Pirellulaceae bacterium]|nr:sulfatase [Pirellulaceae bacterium]
MRKAPVLLWTIAWLGTMGMFLARNVQADPASKLNVLLIVSDDLNTRVGCHGDLVAKTPNIDKLAVRGVRFEKAYCQYPLCNPSRTSFLSGRRPSATRIYANDTPPRTTLGSNVVFFPEHFRAHGYFTARVGKIAHNTFEDAVQWDISEDPRGPHGEDLHRQAYVDDRISPGKPGAYRIEGKATDRTDAAEPDGTTARRVVEMLEQNKDKTFFIAAGFYRPHEPFVCPKKYFDMYPPETIQMPQEPIDHIQRAPTIAFQRVAVDAKMTDEDNRKGVAAYLACTSFMDAQVGVVLDALDRLKLNDRTVVIFLSDHGFMLGEHGGLWRKMHLFDESTHVPLIISAPSRTMGAACPRMAELVDLYPTLCDLCGLEKPEGLEGTSLAPLLDDPNRSWKKAAFTLVFHRSASNTSVAGRSLTTERYRYTEWGDERTAELYDHQADPREYNNLAQDPKHVATVSELQRLLKEGWKGNATPE